MLNRLFPRGQFRCLDEQQLAAYVDQQLIGAERERVETHLAKCDACLAQVAFLAKHERADLATPPEWLIRRAERLQSVPPRSIPAWKWVASGAATAVIIGVLLVSPWKAEKQIIQPHEPTTIASAEPPVKAAPSQAPAESDTAVRSTSIPRSGPVLISPKAGEVVSTSQLVIRWEPVHTATSYEVRIVTAEGDLVWQAKVTSTSVSTPHIEFRQGSKYFVWVRALMRDGKTQNSGAVPFIAG